MFHKNVLNPVTNFLSEQLSSPNPQPAQNSALALSPDSTRTFTPRLTLVPPGGGATPEQSRFSLIELVQVAAPRCSSFFAEAAVLVLVLALLDRFMLKGRLELNWVVGAFAISCSLLAASILTDYSSRRWLRRHQVFAS